MILREAGMELSMCKGQDTVVSGKYQKTINKKKCDSDLYPERFWIL